MNFFKNLDAMFKNELQNLLQSTMRKNIKYLR